MAIFHLNFHSNSINRSVYPVVFTPDQNNWNDRPMPYRTLYFLNGYSGGGLETSQFTNFALYSMMYGVAIVLIDGENSFYVDDEKRNAFFSVYTGKEIVDVTRHLLPLSMRREDTYIGGISMGGYGAIINGLRYSDTFSKIVMLSPALGLKLPNEKQPEGSPCNPDEVNSVLGMWNEYEKSYKDYNFTTLNMLQNGKKIPDMFIACGKQDALIHRSVVDFVNMLSEAKAPITFYEDEGGHDHDFWKKALTPAMQFINKEAE